MDGPQDADGNAMLGARVSPSHSRKVGIDEFSGDPKVLSRPVNGHRANGVYWAVTLARTPADYEPATAEDVYLGVSVKHTQGAPYTVYVWSDSESSRRETSGDDFPGYDPDASRSSEYRRALLTPGFVNVNTGAAAAGTIDRAGDSDWFRVWISLHEDYTVRVDQTDNRGCLRVRLRQSPPSLAAWGAFSRANSGFSDSGTIDLRYSPTAFYKTHNPAFEGIHYIEVEAGPLYTHNDTSETRCGLGGLSDDEKANYTTSYPATEYDLRVSRENSVQSRLRVLEGNPGIRGRMVVGQQLTVDTGPITDEGRPGTPTYTCQWRRDGTDIPGATSETYTLVDSDAGSRMSVQVSFTDTYGNAGTRSTLMTSRVITPVRKLVGHTGDSTMLTGERTGLSQGFRTGNNAHGYLVDHATFHLRSSTATQLVEYYSIRIHEAYSTYQPQIRRLVAILENPGRLRTSLRTWTFNAPLGTLLECCEERYTLGAVGLYTITFGVFGNTDEDSDGLDDWDMHHSYQALRSDFTATADSANSGHLHMAIYGRERHSAAPYLTGLSVSSDPANGDSYATGETIEFIATLSAAAPGVLVLPVTIGSDTLELTAASDSDTYVFRHTVAAGERDDDGISVGRNALRGYVDADLGHSPMADAVGHRVNWDETPQSQLAANTPATGVPGITGSASLDETLTADTSGIADQDGMTRAVFTYQWIRHDLATATDTDIEGATGSTYTVTAEDQGYGLRVRVTFTDDAGNQESLTSDTVISAPPLIILDEDTSNTPATGVPGITGAAQVGETLTADTSGIADEDGLTNAAFTYQWLADDAEIPDASASTYTVAEDDVGKTLKVTVTFTDDAGNEESLTSAATNPVAPRPNTPATGAPAIGGTAQVGETLTVDTSGIADDDGLTGAAFTYQWIRHDLATTTDTYIDGATASTYTVTADDEGHGLRVRVTFTDDAGNEESLTSAATATVRHPLTASFHDAPDSHDGTNTFTFELRFSENISLSFRTLRDHAFTVTGGEVTGARRLVSSGDSRNLRWEITVSPDGNGAVTIVLPATGDCADQGAICTSDGRKLSNRLELVVPGPGG